MTGQLLIVGGRQRAMGPYVAEWQSFQAGVVLKIDTVTGAAETVFEYVSPPTVCAADRPSVLFKAATVDGGQLYLCTQTEVLRLRLSDFRQDGYWTHPWFNDVHHVVPDGEGGVLVANTGLDQVLRLGADGALIGEWNLADTPTWSRFDRGIDYRLVPTTKPHAAHPNFLFRLDGQLWVTRFEQRDAICLENRERRMIIGVERPHDGIVDSGRVLFTTVDGHLVIADGATAQLVRVIDLNAASGRTGPLGWCRGLSVVDHSHAWVGFSRLRATRLLQNLSWIKHGFRRVGTHAMAPTRVALYDLIEGRSLREYILESYGLNAVFSIHSLSPNGRSGNSAGR